VKGLKSLAAVTTLVYLRVDESPLDDLFSFAKEEGGKIWWLKLIVVASQFTFKFAWRRFGDRKAMERAGSAPKGRDEEEF
jgi:hypothetical protein